MTAGWNRGLEVALVFCAVVFSGLFRWVLWQRLEPLSITDMAFYVDIARAIQALDFSRIMHFHYGALYPFFIFLFHVVFGLDWGDAARWVNVAFGALTVVPVYVITRRIFNLRTALFALLLSSMAWAAISSVGYAEAPFGLFAYLAMMMVVPAWKNQGRWFVLAGLTAGLASLVKAEGFFFWVVLFIVYLSATFRRFKIQLPYYVGYILIYFAVTSPYTAAYYNETGLISISPKSRTLFFVHNEDYRHFLYDIRRDDRGWYTNAARIYLEGDRDPLPGSIAGYAVHNFPGLAKNYFSRMYFNLTEMIPFLCFTSLPLPIPRVNPLMDRLVPVLAGLVLVIAFVRRRGDYASIRGEAPLYFILAAGLASVAVYNPWLRFFYGIFPILVIVYAKGMDQAVFWVEAALARLQSETVKKHRKSLNISASLIIAAIIVSFQVRYLYQHHPDPGVERDFRTKKEIARWLKPRITEDTRIMGYGLPNRAAYFLDMPPEREIILPIASIDQAVEYARQENVKYLIVEGEDLFSNYESYAPLFSRDFVHPDLRKEVNWAAPGEEPFVIYSIINKKGAKE